MKKSASTLNPEQKDALECLLEGGNIFLTGKAGTGKSFLIEEYLKRESKRSMPVVASTGAAAILVGGRTFHSFFGLGILEGGRERTLERALRSKKLIKRLQKCDGVVIDEISMIPGLALDLAEKISRVARESNEPWGGMRVIAVGDFWQLPPVSQTGKKDWAFDSEAWKKSQFTRVSLEKVVRTQDANFLNILNQVRVGLVSEEVNAFLKRREGLLTEDFEGTRLFPLRAQVEAHNLGRLKRLDGPLIELETTYIAANDRARADIQRVSPVGDCILLKPEALVMIVMNDPLGRYVNGSLAYVYKLEGDKLQLRLLNGEPLSLGRTDFSLLDADGNTVATARNFPVRLAYASTIHKAQGMTLDRLRVDLSRAWEHGQAYVALSRVRSSAGLFLDAWNPNAVVIDPAVSEFYGYQHGE